MADFSFDLNALTQLQDTAKTLLSEQDEANRARRERDEMAQRLAAEKVKLAKGAQDVAIDTATRAKTHLDAMDASLERVNEINDSWMLRVIEPMADGLKLKNYSRKELLRGVQTEEAALSNSMARAELETRKLAAKDVEISAKMGAADAKLALETGDVTSIASSMETLKQLRVDSEAIREGAIANADDNTLRLLAEQGVISPQRYKEEAQIRTSKTLSLQSQQNAAVLQNYQIQAAKIEALSDDDLRNPERVKGLSPRFVQEELQRRTQQQMAWDQQRISLMATERANAAQTMTDEELRAAGEKGKSGMTPYAADREVKTREAEAAVNEARRSRAEAQAAANAENAKALWLNSASIQQLQDALNNGGGQEGITTIKGPKGEEMQISSPLVAQALKLKLDVQQEMALLVGGAAVAEPAIESTVGEIERVMGVNPMDTDGLPLSDRLTSLYKNDALDSETKTGLDIARTKYGVAKDGKLGAANSVNMMGQSMEVIAKTRDALKERRLATTAAANKVGMKEYFETGRISKVETSIPLAATAAVVNESTGNPLYDSATNALRQSIVASQGDEKNKAESLVDKFANKEYSPPELAAMNVTKEDVQNSMAAGIVSGVLTEAHANSFAALGLVEDAKAIRAGTYFENNLLNERTVLETLKKHNISVGDYMETLREAARMSAKQLMTPAGENGHIIAAYNKLLFNNQNEAYAENYALARIQDAVRGVTDTKTQAQQFTDVISQISW